MSKHIRDPIYGYITVEDDEMEVLDSKQVQRLRRISQLGLSHLVYPSATHTRFMHSMGVLYLSDVISKQIGLSETERKNHRMAAMLHDSGHGPFSHASEIVSSRRGLEHEEISLEIVEQLENKIPAEVDRVKEIIRGEGDLNIIAGEIDCDRMDYLKRDAKMSGLEHGDVDIETILKSMKIVDDEVVIEQRAAQATANFLSGRFFMRRSLYSHDASKIAEKMLAHSLDKYVNKYSVREMMRKDDYTMHSELMSLEEIGKLYRRAVETRDIYKVCEKINIYNSSKENLKRLSNMNIQEQKEEICDIAEVQDDEVILDKPSIPSSEEYTQKIEYNGEIRQISDCVPIVSNLEEQKWQHVEFAVYGPEGKKDEIKRAFKTVFEDYYDKS